MLIRCGAIPASTVSGNVYSITSSARNRIDCGTVRPSALAPVLNHHLLAPYIRQPVGEHSCNWVGCPTRWEGNDEPHKSTWISLRPCDPRGYRQDGCACGHMQKSSAWKFHNGILSWIISTPQNGVHGMVASGRKPCGLAARHT